MDDLNPEPDVEIAVPQRIGYAIRLGRTRDFSRISGTFQLPMRPRRVILSVMQRQPISPPSSKVRPTELCMLAGRWNGVMPDPAGAMVERKHDGFRCLFFPGLNGRPGLWTRGGMPMPGTSHILARLLEVEAAIGAPHMIDGEFVVDGTLVATKAHYDRGWRQGDAGVFHAFDAVPMEDWRRGWCDMPLHRRKAELARAIATTAPDAAQWEWRAGSRGAGHGVDAVELVADTWAFTAADAEAEGHSAWAAGQEGVMIKRADAPYVRARSHGWLKVKRDIVH